MSATSANAALAQDPFVYLTADIAKRETLIALARRFKGISPDVDARIDAAAARIYGFADAGDENLPKMVPGERRGANRVPLYFEGEPGVGKTSIVRSAAMEFCEIAGLNFVENPPDNYVIKPNDFYYVTSNLSGKQNTSEFGGMPFRTEAGRAAALRSLNKTAEVGGLVGAEAIGRAKAIAAFNGLRLGEIQCYEDGPLTVTEIPLAGDLAKSYAAVESIMRTIGDDAKRLGVRVSPVTPERGVDDDRVTYEIVKSGNGVVLYINSPAAPTATSEHVTATLPNLRFHLAKHARFALFNFDDVANASEPVRNVLLEVAQSGRYSGVMDIGNAMVTFTGNMGAEDNTNTMSRQSDAEVTRVRKFRIMDTPENWAKRTAAKYAYSSVGDCHFSSFIARHGNQEGIFREPPGSARAKRGIPKSNSRSIENALNVVDGYFMLAESMNVNPICFLDSITSDVAATTGKRFSISYREHLQSMLSYAVPLAEQCMKDGKMDMKLFEEQAGHFTSTSQKDFGFRFAYALADEAARDMRAIASNSEGPDFDAVKKSFIKMCTGLCQLDASTMNASLSRFAVRAAAIDGLSQKMDSGPTFSAAMSKALGEAIGETMAQGMWPDPDAALQDISSILLGANTATAKARNTAKGKRAKAAA